ncbi:MAG: ABC transporter permease [Lachnospiraceae bacterium]|nr:ABC transporter permease [Lachnospiraceae bacterium]
MKYLSFFRMRFAVGLQYRIAALAGAVTQFAWGFMEIMIFKAFYRADASSFPMSFQAAVSYVWLQQAFLALFAAWMMENEIFDTIVSGNVAYELCRPVGIYDMWFARNIAGRLSRAVLRCFPILAIAVFLPEPYGIAPPASLACFALFLVTAALGLLMTVSFCMLVYVLSFFTISPAGLRILFVSGTEFLAGGVIPLPFFPDKVRFFMELLPFAGMQNVALRVYSGSMSAGEIKRAVLLQLFWLAAVTGLGKALCRLAEKKITVQGG